MSKVAKGIGKAVSGVARGVKKVFNKVVGSKLGKIVLIAAAIYFGGVALGAWGGPVAGAGAPVVTATPAWTAAGAELTAAETAAIAAEGAAAGAAGATVESAALGGTTGSAPVTTANPSWVAPGETGAVGGTGASSTSLVDPLSSSTPSNIADPAFKQAGKGWADAETLSTVNPVQEGNISRLLSGVKGNLGGVTDWIGENPWPAVIGLNAASSLLNDEQGDAWDREDKERARRNKNLEGVAGVDLGFSPSGKSLTYSDGSPVYSGGLVGSRMSGG
jgi:hypothetical protein